MDSDFLWFDENLLVQIISYFNDGYQCVGAELYYDGFDYVNDMYPERAGWLAPCVFGMFIDRKLCKQTFICTRSEGYNERRETGWRIREKLIQENIKMNIFKSFQFENENCGQSLFYKDVINNTIVGVHLLQGSGRNNGPHSITILDDLYKMYLTNK